MQSLLGSTRILALCGKAASGKDTVYEHVLKPIGFLRWPMTLHYKVWMIASGQATWDEVFYDKPPRVRKMFQEDMTALRDTVKEDIWLCVIGVWFRALQEIVGLTPAGIAITDCRFLEEIRGLKAIGAKILHIEAFEEQSNLTAEQKTHRSEIELDSPAMKMLRDAYVFNQKNGLDRLKYQINPVLGDWGWV